MLFLVCVCVYLSVWPRGLDSCFSPFPFSLSRFLPLSLSLSRRALPFPLPLPPSPLCRNFPFTRMQHNVSISPNLSTPAEEDGVSPPLPPPHPAWWALPEETRRRRVEEEEEEGEGFSRAPRVARHYVTLMSRNVRNQRTTTTARRPRVQHVVPRLLPRTSVSLACCCFMPASLRSSCSCARVTTS